MIPGMYHLVRHGIFQMAAVSHLVGTDQDAVVGVKTTGLTAHTSVFVKPRGTTATEDVGLIELAVEILDSVGEKANYRRIVEEPFQILFAALTVGFFLLFVTPFLKVKLALLGHLPR